MRRGFQAAAERLAAEVREELGLEADDRFDPGRLADAYGIPTVALTDLSGDGADPRAIRHLTIVDNGCFSAATVFTGTARFIVYNPTHSDRRLANSLAHELAHVLLEHEPGPLLGPGGCRTWDREVEAEADTLAGMLLVPRQGALAIARVGLPHAVGAARFGVSLELMRWRTGQSGAAKQAAAEARRWEQRLPAAGAFQDAVPSLEEMAWLADLSAPTWRSLLRRCAAAIASEARHQLYALLAQ